MTAGNASGLNDGAAALVLMSAAKARELGVTPLARWVGAAAAGVEARVMGLGPIPATRKLLSRTGLSVQDLDLIELNEAFAAQALACIRELDLPQERVNVNGGAIALGHPLGMSGARLIVALTHELARREAVTDWRRCAWASGRARPPSLSGWRHDRDGNPDGPEARAGHYRAGSRCAREIRPDAAGGRLRHDRESGASGARAGRDGRA